MKYLALLAFACLAQSAAAGTVAPFNSDGCVPGFTDKGKFVDENGKVLDGKDWIATADKQVLTKLGERVFLHKTCLGLLAGSANGLLAGLSIVIVGLAVGGTSSTNGTN